MKRKTSWEGLAENTGLIYPISMFEMEMDHISPRAIVNASVYQNLVDAQRCLGATLGVDRNVEFVTGGENRSRWNEFYRVHPDVVDVAAGAEEMGGEE